MGLREYVKKRNFSKTSEPEAGIKKAEGNLKFVVQRHHASHLHYDFRLELEGVLKSWAVPKGPSLNPKDKRLAMMVEDHPYEYRTFEGIISEGNYGAGVVTIFDEGTYESLSGKNNEKELKKGLYSGNLKFRLYGKTLKGEFALVKIKNSDDNSWLLVKHRDEFAVDNDFNSEDLVSETIKKKGINLKKKAGKNKNMISTDNAVEEKSSKTPASDIPFKLMHAKSTPPSELFDSVEWIYERALKGQRVLAYTGKKVKLISDNEIDLQDKYKSVVKALAHIKTEAIIDGELIDEDKNKHDTVLKYYAFDLLSLDGHDLRSLELIKRKKLLKALLNKINNPLLIYNEHVRTKGKKLFSEAAKNGWEGIIAKEASGVYESNIRSDKWLKFKLK